MPKYTTYHCKSCGKLCENRPNTKSKYCSIKCQMFDQRATRVKSGTADVKTISRYLKERGIYECVKCGNDGNWRGEHLPLHLDHINGDKKNGLLENVRWMCPNCHQQTDTWGVKNMGL